MTRLKAEEKVLLFLFPLVLLIWIFGILPEPRRSKSLWLIIEYLCVVTSTFSAIFALWTCRKYGYLATFLKRLSNPLTYIIAMALLVLLVSRFEYRRISIIFIVCQFALSMLVVLWGMAARRCPARRTAEDLWLFFKSFWIYLVFIPLSFTGLEVITLFTPFTLDGQLKQIDIAMWGSYPDSFFRTFGEIDILAGWLSFFYDFFILMPIVLGGVLFIKGKTHLLRKVNFSFLLCGFGGWIFYLFVPAIGPVYYEQVRGLTQFSIALRNCFPSLHTSWICLVLIYAWKYERRVFAYFFIPCAAIVASTLLLRFHYVIDLLAAVPYIILVYSLTETFLSGRKPLPWLHLCREKAKVTTLRIPLIIYSIFFLSGFTALVYEMFFMKKLSLIFGSTALAVTTVLASYMMGLALGHLLGGKLADRVFSPVRTYGYLEFIVGAVCSLSPLLFGMIQDVYVHIGQNTQLGLVSLSALRMALSAAFILLPTLAMGATLPLVTRYVTQTRSEIQQSIPRLYSTNIIGAAAGTFVATYLFIPSLGLSLTLYTAVAINFAVCLAAFHLARKKPASTDIHENESTEEAVPAWHAGSRIRMNHHLAVAVFLLGFVSFGAEVLWTHILAMIIGNSVYAFGIMLFTVLAGLSIGGHMAGRLNMRLKDSLTLVFYLQTALAVLLLLQLALWDRIPPFLGTLKISAPTFASREFVRFIISFGMLVFPTITIGFAFSVMAALFSQNMKSLGSRLGRISFYNTTGNIMGTLVTGFILIPFAGSFQSTRILAVISLLVGLSVLSRSLSRYRLPAAVAGTAFTLLLLFFMPRWDLTSLSLGTNVYFEAQHWGRVIDHWEEKDGGFTTVTIEKDRYSNKEKLTLWTNGKFQGDNTVEIRAQYRFALYPCLFLPRLQRSLVIGLGTGASARVPLEMGFGRVDIVEISPGIVKATKKYFTKQNGGVLDHPRSHLHVTDGRNYLLLNKTPYDLITMEISSIWFSGAASLYSREFYELARRNLTEHGVFQQWIQLHHISQMDVLSIIGTLRSVFPHVRLFYGGTQGVLVASGQPLGIPYARINSYQNRDDYEFLRGISPFSNFLCLLGEELIGEIGIQKYLHFMLDKLQIHPDRVISTDDDLYLEYATPRGNVMGYNQSLKSNLRLLSLFQGREQDMVNTIPGEGEMNYVRGCSLMSRKQWKEARVHLETAVPFLRGAQAEEAERLLDILSKINQQQQGKPAEKNGTSGDGAQGGP